MNKDEALQMCLEYIETAAHERKYVRHAIKQALAQPAQEPVAINWDAVHEKLCGVWRHDLSADEGLDEIQDLIATFTRSTP
jgi:hypothetical protein